MSLQYSRHDLWRKEYEFNYDLDLLSLSWLRGSNDDDVDGEGDESKTTTLQEKSGENLIYFSVSTNRGGEYHLSVIEEIVRRFNLSTPKAHLKPSLQKLNLSLLEHRVHCLSVRDSEGVQLMLRQVEMEQKKIAEINAQFRPRPSHSPSSSSSASRQFDTDHDIPLPINLIIIGELEEILFPASSLEDRESRDRWLKNLNFLFKNSDSFPDLKNVIILLTLHHSPSDTSSAIHSLPALKEYLGQKFNRGGAFNGDALVGRISRFAVQDPTKPNTPPSPFTHNDCRRLYNTSDVSPPLWRPSQLSPETFDLFNQTVSSYFSEVNANATSRDRSTSVAPSSALTLLVISLILAVILILRRWRSSDSSSQQGQRIPLEETVAVVAAPREAEDVEERKEEKEEEKEEVLVEDRCDVTVAPPPDSTQTHFKDALPLPEMSEIVDNEVDVTQTPVKTAGDVSRPVNKRTPFSSPPNEMHLRSGKTYVPKSIRDSNWSSGRKRGSTSRSRSRSSTLETANVEAVEQLIPSSSRETRSKEKSARKRK